MYVEDSKSNEIKGFTKNFVKRTKDKKSEDVNIKDLLNFVKEKKTRIGFKVCEKNFKKNLVEKIYVANNCEELALRRINHYANLVGCEVITLELNNSDLAQKLAKPFLVSVITVVKEANN